MLVLADTHLRSGPGRRWLPPVVADRLALADAVLHAGDVVDGGVLERIREEAGGRSPFRGVLGNNDTELTGLLPETVIVELAGVSIGMIHDSGPAKGRERRLHDRFPQCAVVVFGHSHIPWNRPGLGGQLLFNPGSPTQRRAQPRTTYGWLRLGGGEILEASVLPAEP